MKAGIAHAVTTSINYELLVVYAHFATISRPLHTKLSTTIYFHKSITTSSSNIKINPFTTKAYSANHFVLRKMAQNLPVSQQLPQLLSIIKQHNIVVVVGETGSGKTTQLPKAILLNEEFRKGSKKIALT
jgi:HrpA-like RNA helicase